MKGDMLIMDQTQWNSQMSDLVGNMINLLNEQQKKIDTMQDVITKMGKGLTDTMEVVQRHDEGINMIMKKMIALGFDK
jgi:hypothetical protein